MLGSFKAFIELVDRLAPNLHGVFCKTPFFRQLLAAISSWALLAGFIVSSTSAQALDPALQNGLNWLQAQIQPDGSLTSEAASVATPFQARTESAYALRDLASLPPSLTAAIQAESENNNEYSSRRLLISTGSANPADVLNELISRQNPDGGFGGIFQYQSNPLDTAFALMAARTLAGNGLNVSQIVSKGLAYLGSAQGADGSWVSDSQGNVFVTSVVLSAVQEWYSVYTVGSMTSRARDWLMSQRSAGSYPDILDSAAALIALSGQTSAADVIGPLSSKLLTAQGADGSWLSDPYLTALALRALWASSKPPQPVSTTGEVSGRVIDMANGAAIPQVAVQLLENTNYSIATGTDGRFALSGVTPGTYTLRVSKLGYEPRQLTVTVISGEAVAISDIALKEQALMASISGVVRASNGTVIASAVVSVGTVSTVTSSTGTYSLTGLSPGAATITAAKSGYLTASANVSFAAGVSYTFSPTLYTSSAPATATLRGKLTDAVSGAAISGGAVTLGGVNKTTAADGSFEYTGLETGVFTLTVSASGYQGLTASGSLSVGVNDLGKLALKRLPDVSILSGTVTDVESGVALANAQIHIQGTALSAVTAADGTYSLANVTGAALLVNVSAEGYQSASFNLVLTSPGNVTANFPLLKLQPSGIAISEIIPNKTYYAPYDELEVDVKINNSNASSVDLVIEAQVLDSLNTFSFEMPANAKGLGLNPPNLPVTITAAGSHDIELSHFMNREPGGQHTILVRAYDTSGRVVAEGTANFMVRDEALLGGGLGVTPPLTQAGSGIPVNFTAQLGNFGNMPIDSATAELAVTLDHPDTSVSTRPETSVSQITNNSLLNPSRSLARDKSGSLYTVKTAYNDGRIIKIDAAGNATVFATVPKTTGVPTLIHVLVDAADNVWVADTNARLWKITQAGVISEIKIASLTSLTGFDVNAAGEVYATGVGAGKQALVKRNADGTETVLWSNGLSTPVGIVSDGAGGYVISNSGDGSLVKLSSSGSISAFANGLSVPKGIARDGAGNYLVVNSGSGSIVKIAQDGTLSTMAGGLSQPADIAINGTGDLFVTTWGDGAVYRVTPSGTSELYAQGLANRPQGMKYDAGGNLYVAGDDGSLRKKDVAGQVSVVATGISSPHGLDFTSAGDVLVASYGAGSVVRVSSGAGKSNFITGLSGPYGVAVTPANEVWVTEQGQNRIAHIGPDGALLERIESVLLNPQDLTAAPDGKIWVANNNFITLVEGGVPAIWSRGRAYRKIAHDPQSGGLVALSSYDVYRIDSTGNASKVKTLASYSYDVSVSQAGDIIVTSGSVIQKLDSSGALTTLAAFPTTVQALSADNTGRFYVMAGGKLYRTETDFTVTPLAVPNNEYAYWAEAGLDGQLLVWTNYGRLYRVNPDTAAFVKINGISQVTSAISDAAGVINVVYSSNHDLNRYDASGSLLGRITGFISPRDAVWLTGGLRFVDGNGRMFQMTPGQIPQLLGGSLYASYLSVRGADLFATNNTSNLYRWNGTAWTAARSVAGASNLTGIAARQDGAITVGDNAISRVVTLDGSSYATLQDFGGLTTPWGITVAPDGRIYLADYGSSSISRLEGKGEPLTFIARVSSPRYLAAEPAGTLLVSRSGAIDRLNPATGAATALPAMPGQPEKMLVEGADILSVDSQGRVFRFNGSAWSLVASGINSTRAIGLLDDKAYLLNGNGALTVYQSGQLDVLADTGIAQPRSLARIAGGWLAGGDSAAMAMVDQAGGVTPISIASLVSNKPIYGLHGLSAESNALLAGDGSGYSVYRLTISQPQEPPAAGTVVFTKSMPVASLPSGESLLTLDYGEWVPPYGGGFKAEVTVPGVIGKVSNYLYAGPHAQGLLSTTSEEQSPGSQTVPFNLRVAGADFVSLSRVETGLVRPLTTIGRPYGMVGDKAGNLWYSDATSLYRKTVAGVNEAIATGLTLAFGLAVDSLERFYLASKNASTGRFELIRITTDGAKAVVADLGVTRVNGVAVNSRDEVFVGAPGNLMKVNPVTGAVSTFTTVGLPNPRGIAIDGKDNVYVQNESDIVSMIKPYGSSMLLYSKGDGVNDPAFEGDGYPNIAADCADNFYIAPYYWQKIKQSGEEHILAQVVARTGQVSALFDGLQISSRLSDIDYLSFDRFGSRILMWADYVNEIWQVPVTCGAISVEAHLLAQPGQALTGFNRPPSAVVPLADGRTEYVFSLRDVSAQGASISGVTELTGLILGENRPVMESSHLLFQNSFSPQQVQLPVDVPSVHVRNLVDLAVSTDKPEYPAGATASISGSLTNQNTRLVSGGLRVEIEDASGVLVAPVIDQPAVLGGGETLPFSAGHAIGSIVPGSYVAVARLYENGEAVAVARAGFKVLADQGQATAYSKLSLDRQTYAPSDRVVISSRVTNRSLNVLLENLRLVIRVLDPSGVLVQMKEHSILQLPPGLSRQFTTDHAFLNAAPGIYRVEQTLLDADGRTFDQQVAEYRVQSSSETGFGLTGAVILPAQEFGAGEAVSIAYSVSNNGNAAIAGLPLILSIVSPETQQVLAQFPVTIDIDAGGLYAGGANWTATGLGGETYAAILQAETGGKSLTLAQEIFKIKKDMIKLDLSNQLGNNARLLVLAGCGKHVEHDEDHDGHADDEDHDGHPDDESHEGHDEHCEHDAEPHCSLQRSESIHAMLTEQSIGHFVTADPAVFLSEVRSGKYNTYWISGKVEKMHEQLDEEIREAAFRGETVLFDGIHDERNKTLDEVAGVQIHGKLGHTGQTVYLSAPFEQAALPAAGRGLKLKPTTGQTAGRFGLGDSDPTAVAVNLFGYGHGLMEGFDLVESVPMASSGWKGAFSQGLAWAKPPLAATQLIGDVVEFQMTVTNQGVDTETELRLDLPAGAVYLSSSLAPATVPDADHPQAVWRFALGKEASRTVSVLIRLPELPGGHVFVSEAGAVKNGVYQRYGDPVTSTVSTASALQNLNATVLGIQQLPITLKKEREYRDQAIAKIDEAKTTAAYGNHAETIEKLVAAIDTLAKIKTVSIKEVRFQLDMAIKEAEWMWFKTQ
ncbi:MAG: carboxypeptidase regulatory-like domain-containing protein [Hydrogenophilaceae bacterium]|nr:carboxypeptidase regulatory-like domain-containing protein [Hydrogenophilaceae bacterium]